METDKILQLPSTEQGESIKLNTGMKGQRGWEIRIRTIGDEKLCSKHIDRLKQLDLEMTQKFGGAE